MSAVVTHVVNVIHCTEWNGLTRATHNCVGKHNVHAVFSLVASHCFGDSKVNEIFHIESLRATAFSTVNMVVVCIKINYSVFLSICILQLNLFNKSIHNPLISLLPSDRRKPKTIILICIVIVSGSGFIILVSSMFVLIENQLENRMKKKKGAKWKVGSEFELPTAVSVASEKAFVVTWVALLCT